MGFVFLPMALGCAQAAKVEQQATPSVDYVQERGEYLGRTLEAVLRGAGTPYLDQQFKMSQAYGEMRVELLNVYPLSDPKNATVEIKELWWKDGDYFLTLWFHQFNGEWIVLDTLYWHKDVTF